MRGPERFPLVLALLLMGAVVMLASMGRIHVQLNQEPFAHGSHNPHKIPPDNVNP